jgi:hypothetical protein
MLRVLLLVFVMLQAMTNMNSAHATQMPAVVLPVVVPRGKPTVCLALWSAVRPIQGPVLLL